MNDVYGSEICGSEGNVVGFFRYIPQSGHFFGLAGGSFD